ncbi:MAG TPA: TetR/AcrR family transcriptional regulator [Polyangiales bacterium]|jgi:AcrR family transcriptional regulator
MGQQVSELSGKREQTKLRNRSLLLAAARLTFVELGYDAATVRDIVARTALAPGTFYNYFPDKRSVLVALMSETSAEATRRAREARAQASSLEELVHRGFRAYFDFIASDPSTFELMRRNLSTLRSLGLDETGFTASVEDLRADLSSMMESGALPHIPLEYLPLSIGAIAFEVGAAMVANDPPDIEGATEFAAEFCIGAIERFGRIAQRKGKRRTNANRRDG